MVEITGSSLSLKEVFEVARNNEPVSLSNHARKAAESSFGRVLEIVKADRPVYGINTGYGVFADQTISKKDRKRLNRNLIISHAVGTGDFLPIEVVRAAMLIRMNALAKGFSGVNPEILKVLGEMLNKGVTPVVDSQGSLGSSGDLCMLSQMALVFTCDQDKHEADPGHAFYIGDIYPGNVAMQKAGLDRLVLDHKDGLALINGASFTASALALACSEAAFACYLADISASMSLEALLGKSDSFDPRLHAARGMEGQVKSAANILKMINGSSLVNSHDHVQDAYSLRCAPQVHGAVRDAVAHTARVLEKEINAATDNPLVFGNGDVLSGGNFHGEPLGLVGDYLSSALSELGAISERRVFRLIDKNLNFGLPPMLVDDGKMAGLNSGVMMLQYTAAALALENQALAAPDSVRSLPTSANQEDHNANSWTAAKHTSEILRNTIKILGIELFTSCRALEIRMKSVENRFPGLRTADVFELIRGVIPYSGPDSLWGEQMENLYNLLLDDFEFRRLLNEVLN